jgi:hypothetical protein
MGKAFGIRARPEPAPQLLAASTAEPLAECLLTMLAVETPRERDWLGVFSLTGAVSSLARTSGPRLSDESVLHIEIRGWFSPRGKPLLFVLRRRFSVAGRILRGANRRRPGRASTMGVRVWRPVV